MYRDTRFSVFKNRLSTKMEHFALSEGFTIKMSGYHIHPPKWLKYMSS